MSLANGGGVVSDAVGLSWFRARVMRLTSGSFEMKFHRDADLESWRLHVPIITTPESFFEWRLDSGEIERHSPSGRWIRMVRPGRSNPSRREHQPDDDQAGALDHEPIQEASIELFEQPMRLLR
ncbi:MAG: hypothetical protein EXQ94_09355 [Alphaproteobacteria bacterium]|nr:hypothetical protein [Alphaproteobacteria bacterium]